MSQNKIDLLLELNSESPNDPFPYFALAKEYEKISEYDKAIEQYKKLVNDFPSYGGTYYHYAILLIQSQKNQTALEIIESGLTVLLDNGDRHLYSELAGLKENYFE
ncbi:tetratricopeptide repeat protein [Membranihabitans marinus]|uniref:tetratricopeptide repeat protein n=1 Tax=Membranihabitans marinus TaxID=1227546 RepID=UPI001F244ADB|nr:hypothetical protein [Membranihabitans marinus]